MKLAATEQYGYSASLIRAKSAMFPSPHTKSQRIASWSLAILVSVSFYLGPFLLFLPFALYAFYPILATHMFLLNVFLAFYPVGDWQQFRSLFQLWYELFDLRTNMDKKTCKNIVKENSLSILAMHPHGIIPLHALLWGGFCTQMMPEFYGVGASTSIALRLPVLRQILRFMGVVSTQKKALIHSMQVEDKGLLILPGGVAEIFLSHRRRTVSNVGNVRDVRQGNLQSIKAKRYGLMKLSLQTGAAITPAYVFGATDLFDQLAPVTGDKRRKDASIHEHSITFLDRISEVMESFSRRMKGGITLFWGKFYLPIPYTPKLTLCLGDPIYPVPGTEGSESNINGKKRTCKKIANPSEEEVMELMERYTKAIHSLFEQYKDEAGYGNDELEIL